MKRFFLTNTLKKVLKGSKKLLLIIIAVLSLQIAQAQGVSNIWYFGDNAGLDFSTNPPTALTNGMLSTYEGCATIADVSGNLLFYTDGETVYDQNHNIMTNGAGLLGNWSSTQSAIIVKKPGFNTSYYIFTVDKISGSNGGLYYSEVVFNAANPFGYITANKNLPIFSPTCEKICAIQHQNGIDIWIVIKENNSSNYHSFINIK